MNILVVNWQDRENPQSGGAEHHLHEIFGRLAARSHRVTLLVSGWEGAPARTELDGMDVHRAGGRHSFSLAAPAYFRSALRRERFDVVVEDLNKVPLFTPLWIRAPIVLLVHHLFGATAFREASAPFAAATWLLERPIPLLYRDLPTQAVSRSTADDLVDRGLRGDDIQVIHNGVDIEYFAPSADTGLAPEPTFLYIGRLRRYKRIDLVLRAFSLLIRTGVQARLVVAGRGEAETELRALAAELGVAEQVTFAGFVSEEEKRSLLRTSWAVVLASPKEGWGISNIEAAACGTPSVSSDSPGLRESVRHGETGFLVRHGDIAELTAALGRLAADRALTERLGRQARTFAEPFTWNRAADETEAHLVRVASGTPFTR